MLLDLKDLTVFYATQITRLFSIDFLRIVHLLFRPSDELGRAFYG